MAIFYFHLRDHVDEVIDSDGTELADVVAAQSKALAAARGIIAADANDGIIDLRYRIDVEDAAGKIVCSLPFEHAVSVIHGLPEQANDF